MRAVSARPANLDAVEGFLCGVQTFGDRRRLVIRHSNDIDPPLLSCARPIIHVSAAHMPLLLQARSLDTIFGIVAAIFLVSVTLLAVYLVYLFRTRNSDKPRRDDSKRKD
jgi:hypothetical protein